MFLLNGQNLPTDTAFTHDEIQYPANWLRLASADEKAAIGITEVADQPRPDDRYYWVTQNADGTYSTQPKDLSNLQANAVDQVNESVWLMLNKTDFMDSRKAHDPDYTAPADWLEWRAAVRATATQAKAAIQATTTVEELIALGSVQYPNQPDAE